jgi:tRNA A-37 threonylcarbamoyl transferase component Bud32
MAHRDAIVPRPPTASADATRPTTVIPAEVLAQARRRLGIFGLIVAVSVSVAMVMAGPVWRGLGYTNILPIRVIQVALLALSLTVYVLARTRSVPNSTVMAVGVAYQIAICYLASIGQTLMFYRLSGHVAETSGAHMLIVAYPLIVPSPPRQTVLAVMAAVAMVPLSLASMTLMGEVPVPFVKYVAPTLFASIGGFLAVIGSRVIYGIARDAAVAREMGSYKLEALLGKGGMGEVWRARHRLLTRPAAIKLLRPEALGDDPERQRHARARFEREAQATASLRSPHTVALYDFGSAEDGAFYYVMELLEGVDAEEFVRRFGPLPVSRALRWLNQACASLAEAHEAGLVHRDIKPSNIYVCRYGREVDFIKVLDFGLVKPMDQGDSTELNLTVEGTIRGTPGYLPPEQTRGDAAIDARTDIYALGCVAYWLVTGKRVFEGRSTLEVLAHHLQTVPVAPSQRTELPVPPELDALVLACLEKDPALRPQSADDLAARLRTVPVASWTDADARAWWSTNLPVGAPPVLHHSLRADTGATE